MSIYIGYGANLPAASGLPIATIASARARLEQCGIEILKRSGLYRSRAWPDAGEPEYVNAVDEIATGRQPEDLLALLHDIENEFARRRDRRWGSRTLDLDLLDYEGMVVNQGGLVLPHPRMHERGFVLRPLAEIAPGWRHPATGRPINDLLTGFLPATEAKPLCE